MILFVSTTASGSTDAVVHILNEREIPVFRLNTDVFNQYEFLWTPDGFEIRDKVGHTCLSDELEIMLFYKDLLQTGFPAPFSNEIHEDKWVISWLNQLHSCFARYALDRRLARLWTPFEPAYPKTLQMEVARKYFPVPTFSFHWGFSMTAKEVIAKSLTSRFFEDFNCPYAKKVDRSRLDPRYPWFTQELARGDRDATVVYINGRIHGFQFALKHDDSLTDWRVTQGSERNRWRPWNGGENFNLAVDRFMREIGLKFGRLDFIIGGEAPEFLEVNPCGQFGWLDDSDLTLHNEVVDAILDSNSILG